MIPRIPKSALSIISVLCVFGFSALAFAGVDEGDKPTFVATTLDGEKVTSKELRGKVVLVDFWATWCKPCKESFPFYSELVEKYDGKLVVLAVSVDGRSKDVREFLQGKSFAFTVVWNKKHPIAKTFGPSTFPTSYLIDKEGVVRDVHVGFDKQTREQTEAQLEVLIGQ